MTRKSIAILMSLLLIAISLNGCRSTGGAGNVVYSQSFKDYPDNSFNAKAYVKGMSKGGHGLLIWQDTSANLKKYKTVKIKKFGGRLLPAQNKFSYKPFIKNRRRDEVRDY